MVKVPSALSADTAADCMSDPPVVIIVNVIVIIFLTIIVTIIIIIIIITIQLFHPVPIVGQEKFSRLASHLREELF